MNDQHLEKHFARIEHRFDRLEAGINAVFRKEIQLMALGKDILAAVEEETTVIDGVLALMQGLIDDGTVTAADGAKILSTISTNRAKLEEAIVKNTPVDPNA